MTPDLNSPQSGRRRSSVLVSLQMNNPNQPAPGEMVNENMPASFRTSRRGSTSSPISLGDPNHGRNASLGEIHQVMEQEEEAHVNRLLQQIRVQQIELQQLRLHNSQLRGDGDASLPAIDDALTPTSETGRSQSIAVPMTGAVHNPRSPSFTNPRSSYDLARQDISRRSRTPSRTASPRIRTASITGDADPFAMGSRDEGAFYQAETSMMTRENQMLKQRIRELERQLSDTGIGATNHEPTHPSHLLHSQSISDESLPIQRGLGVTEAGDSDASPRQTEEAKAVE